MTVYLKYDKYTLIATKQTAKVHFFQFL